MSDLKDAIQEGYEESREVFGEEDFTFAGSASLIPGNYSSLGYVQVLDYRGVSEEFTATLVVSIEELPTRPAHGIIVTRVSDSKQFRIVGDVLTDIATHTINLSTKGL